MPKATLNGIDIAYEVTGEGPALVLAHGWTATKEMWDGQTGPFSERYRVVTYDARGHGESSAPHADDAGYTLDTYVEDQRALMAHLEIERAIVGGLSMGGMIALRFALAHPEQTRALILCDTGAEMTLGQELRSQRTLIEGLVRMQGVAPVMRNLYAQRAGNAGMPKFEELPEGVQGHIRRLEHMSAEGFLGAGRALADQTSVLDRLGEIEVPTLILTGDADFMRGPSEEMHRRMPEARFVVIEDSAHGTCVWQPERFNAAVLGFLSEVETAHPVAS